MDWRSTPDGALALILLLDQFTRNVHRGTVGAYAGDPCAFYASAGTQGASGVPPQ